MDNRQISRKVDEFIEKVLPEYSPEKIVLYGSYARGNNHEHSDIDIAIIVKEITGDFLEQESKLYKIRRIIDIDIEPILLEINNDKSGFIEHILGYGKVLFDKKSYKYGKTNSEIL